MAHLDILLYALIAAILLVRLWAVFGRRNDQDSQRPNPFAMPAPDARDDEDVLVLDKRSRDKPPPPPVLAPTSLLGVLDSIKQLDPAFDEKQFLQTARTNFTIIVAAFAKGDLADVEKLLGPSVRAGFEAAITARAKAGEALESRIARIRDVETETARIDASRVFVTARITSEQENILRDASGKIVSGAPGKVEEIIDLWTFMHDTKSADPAWQLVETKS